MIREKIEKYLTNEEGSGLVLALMVLLVLSVLGAALGVVTIGSLQLSTVNRDSNSAYYIAEAGANMAYEEFKKDVKESYNEDTVTSDETFFNKIDDKVQNSESPYKTYGTDNTDDFEPQFGDTPTAIVSVDTPPSTDTGSERNYTITSVGKVNGKERTVAKKVSVIWKDKSTAGGDTFPTMPAGAAVIAKNKIKLDSGKIDGYIYIDSDEKQSFQLSTSGSNDFKGVYSNYLGDKKDIYDEVPNWYTSARKEEIYSNTTNPMTEVIDWDSMDNYLEKLKKITNRNDEINLAHDTATRITLKGNYEKDELLIHGPITIDIGSNDVIIFTKKLSKSWGEAKIEGSGSLTIVASDSAVFNGGGILNVGSDKANLRIIFTNQSSEVKINNNGKIFAQIIALNSKVNIASSGGIYGSVIAKSVNIHNAGNVTYQEFAFDDIGTGGGSEELENTDDLFKPGPAIEVDK